MLRKGLEPALGTDSLASAASLDLFEEMAFICEKLPSVSPRTILAMSTANGAKALDREDFGTMRPGSVADLVYVDLAARSGQEAEKKLVTRQFNRVERL